MTPGGYISAAGHCALLAWLFLGWGLDPEPLDFEVTEVTAVTGAEYAALVARTSPDAAAEPTEAPEPPPAEEVPEPPAPEAAEPPP